MFKFAFVSNRIFASTVLFLVLSFQLTLAAPTSTENMSCDGYIGTDLPSGTDVFAHTSPWKSEIPENPIVDPYSEMMIQTLKNHMEQNMGKPASLGFDYGGWSAPMFVIDSSESPWVDVHTTKIFHGSVDEDRDGIVNVPLPDCVFPAPNDDGHMILVDPTANKVWEFARFERGTPNRASRIAIYALDGQGVGEPFTGPAWWAQGVTGEGTSYLGGLARRAELKEGVITHALFIIVPQIRALEHPSSEHRWELSSPFATRSDGDYVGDPENGIQYPLAGARLQLDPNLDPAIFNSLSPDSQIVANALQQYGAVVSDQGNNFTIKAQILDENGQWGWQDIDVDLSAIPIESYRFLEDTVVIKN